MIEDYMDFISGVLKTIYMHKQESYFIGLILLSLQLVYLCRKWKNGSRYDYSLVIFIFLGLWIWAICDRNVGILVGWCYGTSTILILIAHILIGVSNGLDNIRNHHVYNYDALRIKTYFSLRRSWLVGKLLASEYLYIGAYSLRPNVSYLTFKNRFTLYLGIFMLAVLFVETDEY